MRAPERRRYVVKYVGSSPAWTGTILSIGCKHLASAEALFDRQVEQEDIGEPYSALLLIDREQRKVLRSVGSSDPDKTAAYFGW